MSLSQSVIHSHLYKSSSSYPTIPSIAIGRCNLWQHRLLNFDYSQLPLLILLKQVPNNNCSYPRVTSPRSFSLIHSPETGSNWTPTSFTVNTFSLHNPVFFLQNNTKFSMLPLALRAMPIHGLNLSFKNMPKAL